MKTRLVFLVFPEMIISQAVQSVRIFLREEKLSSWLLVLLLLCYAFFIGSTAFYPAGQESAAITQLKAAEEQVRQEQGNAEWFEKMLEKEPAKAAVLGGFTVLFFILILCGVVLDFLFLLKKSFSQNWIKSIYSPPPCAWRPRDIVKVGIWFFVIGLGSNLAFALFRKFFWHDLNENVFLLLHTTAVDILLVFFIFHYAIRKHQGSWHHLGFYFKNVFQEIKIGFLSYVGILPVFLGVLFLLVAVLSLTGGEPAPHPLVEVFVEEDRRSPWVIAYSIFLACVIGPVIEEIFFRGFAYPAFKQAWGKKTAILLTAGIFAWTHNSTFAFVPIFFLGCALAYLYERRGSLIASITLHVTHNTFFIGVFFVLKRYILDAYL